MYTGCTLESDDVTSCISPVVVNQGLVTLETTSDVFSTLVSPVTDSDVRGFESLVDSVSSLVHPGVDTRSVADPCVLSVLPSFVMLVVDPVIASESDVDVKLVDVAASDVAVDSGSDCVVTT